MKVLVWDNDGTWPTTIGSFNWLSAHEALEAVDVPIVVRQQGFTAAVLRDVACIWRSVDGGPGQTQPRIWEAIASSSESGQVDASADAGFRIYFSGTDGPTDRAAHALRLA